MSLGSGRLVEGYTFGHTYVKQVAIKPRPL